jgi:hypothetical protein
MSKLWDYLMLVCFNWYFFTGISVGYVTRSIYGGTMISLFSGLVFGILVHEAIKFIFWR